MAPDATNISVREVLAKFDTDFAPIAQAAENGDRALGGVGYLTAGAESR